MQITRRGFIAGTAGIIATPAMAAGAAPRPLVAGTRTIEVNGKAARMFALTGPAGKPGIVLAPDERFFVRLENRINAPTIIHWHGQEPDWRQDGFPWPQTPPIAASADKIYDFQPIAGTYWMHSHQGMQEQRLMTAPLIVHDAASQQADVQEIVVMLHDFSFTPPAQILAGLRKGGGMMGGMMGGMSGMSGMSSMGGMSGMGNMSGMMGSADLNDVA
ncbi:MAG: multicopper oxidase domain-containing protein, partial [Acidocella sp.]|nr:multicopper oxidase domain-containing protein [Acidocella sp.]